MLLLSSFKTKANLLLSLIHKYRLQRSRYRYTLTDVIWHKDDGVIELAVVISGIKNNIVHFVPEKILYDDDLLSEFSPCDVRAITYLSFRKYLKHEVNSLKISSQIIKNGETIFELTNQKTNDVFHISAKTLRQNHDYLSCLNQSDMINVVSTAVQEQTIRDFKSMESL